MTQHRQWQWLRTRVSPALGWALCASLCLHLMFLSQLDWQLWGPTEAELVTIEARLQAVPRPAPKAVVPVTAPAKKKSVKAKTTPPIVQQPVAKEAIVPVATEASPPPETIAAEAPRLETVPEVDAETADEDTAIPLPLDEDVPITAPYQTVDTAFDVFINGEKSRAGTAEIRYRTEGKQYQLRWEVKGTGLLRLLYPTLTQQSQGDISDEGLRPLHYQYAFGSRADKTYEAAFNWQERIITLKTAKGEKATDLPMHTQDLLSFMYQFMFVPPLQEMQVTLTNGKRLGEYHYAFEGEETLSIAEQTLQTVHIAHTRGDTDEKVELWLATEYRHLPVKIRKTEKNGTVIEQIAVRLIAE